MSETSSGVEFDSGGVVQPFGRAADICSQCGHYRCDHHNSTHGPDATRCGTRNCNCLVFIDINSIPEMKPSCSACNHAALFHNLANPRGYKKCTREGCSCDNYTIFASAKEIVPMTMKATLKGTGTMTLGSLKELIEASEIPEDALLNLQMETDSEDKVVSWKLEAIWEKTSKSNPYSRSADT